MAWLWSMLAWVGDVGIIDGCRVRYSKHLGPPAARTVRYRVVMDCCGFVDCNADRRMRGGAPFTTHPPCRRCRCERRGGGEGEVYGIIILVCIMINSGSFEEWCGATALRTDTKVGVSSAKSA